MISNKGLDFNLREKMEIIILHNNTSFSIFNGQTDDSNSPPLNLFF